MSANVHVHVSPTMWFLCCLCCCCVRLCCTSTRPSPGPLLCAGVHFFGSSTLYLHDSGGGTWSPPTHMSHIMMPSPGYTGGGGILAPPPSTSPTSSPTRPVQGSHSAQASPTNTLKTVRPRARSADESVSGKKVSNQLVSIAHVHLF